MLSPGEKLGPYEILGRIGSGGMGVVYRARDTRLERNVAIKVLSSTFREDAERQRRFEQEARTVGGLNHPNIVALYDCGQHEGAPFLVMELLEGENLRKRLAGRRLPVRAAIEIAVQIAHGLAVAHEKLVIHRDLKPENVFIVRDGRVKLLDFGIAARRGEPEAAAGGGQPPADATCDEDTASMPGHSGVAGTAGYMSPEQFRGEPLDGRSDIFVLGLVLWEMLCGRPALPRRRAGEAAPPVSWDEPPRLDPDLDLPPVLARVVRRCLAKRPEERFHDAHDLAFALESALDSLQHTVPARAPRSQLRRVRPSWTVVLVLVLGLGALAFLLPQAWQAREPSFHRLTRAPGCVDSGFFGADGRTIFFTSRTQGWNPEVFVITQADRAARPVGSQNALLLGVSRNDELAILRSPQRVYGSSPRGRLATMLVTGGARDLQDGVTDAAWDAEGRTLALVTMQDLVRFRLEYPAGTVLRTVEAGSIKLPRARPKGGGWAEVECDAQARTEVAYVDPEGRRRVLFTKEGDVNGDTINGLAWHPSGQEVWVSEYSGEMTALWRASLSGRRALVWRSEGEKQLLDLAPDGSLLMASHHSSEGVLVQRAGETSARDLSIQQGTEAWGLSPDGASVLLLETPTPDGGTVQDVTYLRATDGSGPVRLGTGTPYGLSLDGRYVQFYPADPAHIDPAIAGALRTAGVDWTKPESDPALLFLSTRMEPPWVVPLPRQLVNAGGAHVLPGARDVVFSCAEAGQGIRMYRVDRNGRGLRILTEVGTHSQLRGLQPVSSDGRKLIVRNDSGYHWLSTDGGALHKISGIEPREKVMRWSADGRFVYVQSGDYSLPVEIFRVDPVTGDRIRLHSVVPPEPAGFQRLRSILTTPNADLFVYTYQRRLSELFRVQGLR